MRGGYHTRVGEVTQYEVVERYFEAVSRSTGKQGVIRCGHKHATREEAEGCIEAVTEQYRKLRWPKRKPQPQMIEEP